MTAKFLKNGINYLCFAALLFGVMAVNPVYAQQGSHVEVVPNQYIVVFEDQDQERVGPAIASTGESVLEAAERLMTEASQHQRDIDHQRGIKTALRSVSNELGYVYEYALKGFSVTLTDDALEFLRKKPEIAYIEPDGIMEMNVVQNPTPSWGLDRVDQRNLPLNRSYNYVTGSTRVHVYVIDSGIRASHNEFRGRVGNGFDFIDNDSTPFDCLGHGTHVSGTAGGTRYGVAKRVVLHPVRIFGCSGSSPTSTVIAGVDWVSANHIPPAVANMSLSGGVSRALDNAVANLISTGVTTIVAAGNDSGTNACTKSPARVPNALTVASSTSTDQRSSFSNIGTCVDIFAPGSAIRSAWNDSDDSSRTANGTSMATPHVVGAAALYLEFNPDATPAQVSNAIMRGSTPNVIRNAGAGTPNRLLFSRLQAAPGAPGALYRYYGNGDHFYTTNWNELGRGKSGYRYEGIEAYIFGSRQKGTTPLYRYFGNGDHFYTTNWNELGSGRYGYRYEGVQGYVFPSKQAGTRPLYRYFGNGDHFYTTNWNELGGGRLGYRYEGVQCYVKTSPH